MSIYDYIANPQIAQIGQMYSAGRQDRQMSESRELDHLMRTLQYNEELKSLPLRDMERRKKTQQLEFDLEHQEQVMEEQLLTQRLKMDQEQAEGLLTDIDSALKDEQSYRDMALRHSLAGTLPPELKGEDGQLRPYKEAVPWLQQQRQKAVYTAEHLRNLDLARIKASAKGTPPSYAYTAANNNQKINALKDVERVQGDFGEVDTQQLAFTIAEMANHFARSEADAGRDLPEPVVRQKLLDIAKRHVKKTDKWYKRLPGRQDDELDYEGFLRDVEAEFGLPDGYTSRALQGVGIEISGPAAAFKGKNGEAGPVQIKSADDYNKLKSGTVYIDPNGKVRTKP